MTDARHSSSVWPDDSQSGSYVGEPVGFVLHLESATVYFAGETDVFGDMALIRRLHQPDIVMLPVGDREDLRRSTRLTTSDPRLAGHRHAQPGLRRSRATVAAREIGERNPALRDGRAGEALALPPLHTVA